ncbi:MAG: TIGR02996 domain-containing protein [Myxococcales bacterium]
MQSRKLVHESRFFEITWEDLYVETVEGEAGGEETEPQKREFLAHEEIQDFVERQIQKRLDAGFVDAPDEDTKPEDRSKLLELEALIEADLDAVEPYLVYADYLQSHGDPRGELIALQHRLATAPTDELRAEEQQLFARRATALLGSLADCQEVARLKWRLGFVEKLTLFAARPQDYDEETLLRAFLAEPPCRFLRELVLFDRDFNIEKSLAALAAMPPHPTITRLQLGLHEKASKVALQKDSSPGSPGFASSRSSQRPWISRRWSTTRSSTCSCPPRSRATTSLRSAAPSCQHFAS